MLLNKISYWIFLFSVFCVLPSICFAQATTTEDISITTYYPAPFGVYNELRSQRMAVGANYTSAVWSWDTDGGNPEMNEFRQDADLIVEGNVGIGTVNPRFPAPNAMSGNLDVNDIWLRGATPPRWASEGGTPQVTSYTCNNPVANTTCNLGVHDVCFLSGARHEEDNNSGVQTIRVYKGGGQWRFYVQNDYLYGWATCLDF